MIKFDIYLIFYNGDEFIDEQIQSITSEMMHGDHLFILDDKSKPSSVHLLRKFDEDNVTIVHNEKNLGFNRNIMQCLNYGKNRHVVFCDQDDIWLPGRLQAIRNLSFDICAVGYDYLIDGKRVSHTNAKSMNFYNTFLLPVFPGCTLTVSRQFLEALDFGKLPIESIYDQYLVCKAVLGGYTTYVSPKTFILYRRHGATQTDSKSRIPNGIIAAYTRRLKLARDLIFR